MSWVLADYQVWIASLAALPRNDDLLPKMAAASRPSLTLGLHQCLSLAVSLGLATIPALCAVWIALSDYVLLAMTVLVHVPYRLIVIASVAKQSRTAQRAG